MVERFIRIERLVDKGLDNKAWHTVPLGEKVRVWEISVAEIQVGNRSDGER